MILQNNIVRVVRDKDIKKKKTDIDLNILLFIFVIGNKFNLILNKLVGVQSESARIRHKKKQTFI